jgi:hypothetical protein
MAGDFLTYWSELKGVFPGLSPQLAQTYVIRAYRDIRDARFWSFQKAYGYLPVPPQITTGTFTVTFNSATCVADANAKAALTGLTNPPITSYQIRFAGLLPLYTISSFNSTTGVLTFANQEYTSTPSTTGISYQAYQAYYGPPLIDASGDATTDFLRYTSVVDPVQPRRFTLNKSREFIDTHDPQRLDFTYPKIMASFTTDGTTAQLPLYEVWPHPLYQTTLLCSYQRRGIDFSAATDTLPASIPDDLLMARAMRYGCEWALVNLPSSKTGGVTTMLKSVMETYKTELFKAQKQDNEVFRQNDIINYNEYPIWMNSFLNQMNPVGGVTTP